MKIVASCQYSLLGKFFPFVRTYRAAKKLWVLSLLVCSISLFPKTCRKKLCSAGCAWEQNVCHQRFLGSDRNLSDMSSSSMMPGFLWLDVWHIDYWPQGAHLSLWLIYLMSVRLKNLRSESNGSPPSGGRGGCNALQCSWMPGDNSPGRVFVAEGCNACWALFLVGEYFYL